MSEPQIVYVNTAENAIPEKLGIRERVTAGEWGVVNAPRPLPGEVTWEGEYRHGIFYAAGPLETFRGRWAELDGWPVREVTNEEIELVVRHMCAERGASPEELLENFDGSWAKLAAACNLPWVQPSDETKMHAPAL